MVNRFRNNRLGKSYTDREDPSPMWGVSNMSDVMLVLVVGIMLALVANWNLDIGTGTVKELELKQEQMKELENFHTLEDEDFAEQIKNSGLQELGSVYVSPKTGEMYVIVADDGKSNQGK